MKDFYNIIVEKDFAASHIIHGHPGKCANLHGHNWRVEVGVMAHDLNEIGIGIDFCDVKKHLNPIIEELDHCHLNDLPYFKEANPTAENLCKHVYTTLQSKLGAAIKVDFVTLWETDRSRVTYRQA